MRGFWNSLKAWFLRTFEFCINFTVLDILLGITNYGKIRTLIFLTWLYCLPNLIYIYIAPREMKWPLIFIHS